MARILEWSDMARKKKAKIHKKTSPGIFKRIFGTIDRERSSAFKSIVLKMFCLAVFLGGAALGLDFLEGYVRAINAGRDVELTVELAHRPGWASDELVEQICLSSGVRSDDSLLDDSLVREWAVNLSHNPWIKRVNTIRKRYDGRVVIDCELRKPIAALEQAGMTYYLDPEGVILPEVGLYEHLVILKGHQGLIPAPGQAIRSQALLAGLEVLILIKEVDGQLPAHERLWSELAVLDVGNFEGRQNQMEPHLKFYTQNKTEIRWGAAVGREVPYYEPPAKFKLASLYQAFKKFGSLDEYNYVELRDLRKERCDPLRQNG
ncbi:MAG: hypothetical protein JW860_06845 [Sedimentisphaerales bacterium]|nr:hypothetical protein [Sedimentisphaerales bacterium]